MSIKKNVVVNNIVAMGVFMMTPLVWAQDSEVTITTKTYDDWQVRCEQVKGDNKVCVMTQQALIQESGQRLMQVNIAKKDGKTLMTIMLPLGINLPAGVSMQLGANNKKALEVAFCAQSGCVVNQGIDSKFMSDLTKENEVSVSMLMASGQPVTVPFSTKGFRAAQGKL